MNNKIGIDLVHIKRFKNKISDQKFITKILTKNEIKLFDSISNENRKIEFLAGRFACKEAYAKALKLGIGKVDFHDIEILKDENNAPYTNMKHVDVSISHDNEYVIAIIMVGDNNEY